MTAPTLIALTGHKGAGKDAVAQIIAAALPNARVFAFADTLRAEVCAAFHVPLALLTARETKERPTWELALRHCNERVFAAYVYNTIRGPGAHIVYCPPLDPLKRPDSMNDPLSPRVIMQWWGQFRREHNPLYWVHALEAAMSQHLYATAIITDCRHTNEAEFVKARGGMLIRVSREQTDAVAAADTHESERGDAFALADDAIENNGSVDELQRAVYRMLEAIERRAA